MPKHVSFLIRTIPSVRELHPFGPKGFADYTAGGEFHSAPKIKLYAKVALFDRDYSIRISFAGELYPPFLLLSDIFGEQVRKIIAARDLIDDRVVVAFDEEQIGGQDQKVDPTCTFEDKTGRVFL